MNWLIKQWRTHGTKIIGCCIATLGVLQGSTGVFDTHTQGIIGIVAGVATVWRGFWNTGHPPDGT